MSYNQRLANLQKNVSTNELKNADLDFIEEFVLDNQIVTFSKNSISLPRITITSIQKSTSNPFSLR